MWQLIEFFLAIIGALFLASVAFSAVVLFVREKFGPITNKSNTLPESDIEKIWRPQNARNE